jgi:hypothetical protein
MYKIIAIVIILIAGTTGYVTGQGYSKIQTEKPLTMDSLKYEIDIMIDCMLENGGMLRIVEIESHAGLPLKMMQFSTDTYCPTYTYKKSDEKMVENYAYSKAKRLPD